jgi:hypothetical protein
MQEINELKNLVIQSLEANGVLGQIRAQIRSSVFKIIEMQETNQKKNAGFFWENPLCQTIYDHNEGIVALELIHDFLEHFKMDYTSSVFSHEANLKAPASKEVLAKKIGIAHPDNSKPLLFQIIQSALNGETVFKSDNKENTTKPASTSIAQSTSGSSITNKKEVPKNTEKASVGAAANNNASKTNQIITNLVDKDFDKKDSDSSFNKNKNTHSFPENKQEETKSLAQRKAELFNIGGSNQNDNKNKLGHLGGSGSDSSVGAKSKNDDFSGDDKEKKKLAEAQEKMKQMEHGIKSNTLGQLSTKPKDTKELKKQESDNDYDDEQFEDNVEEELFEGDDVDDDLFYKQDKTDKKFGASSEDIIAASQSQGFDISVDSVQLEEYDYYEEAVRGK